MSTPTKPETAAPGAAAGPAIVDDGAANAGTAAATQESDAAAADPDLKKKELIDLVVTRSGIKKKDAKPVVEAMLAVLGDSVAQGRALNLQPLGKLRVTRTEEKENGRVLVCKLRQNRNAAASTKDPLAAPAE